jgi:hypothetical protein
MGDYQLVRADSGSGRRWLRGRALVAAVAVVGGTVAGVGIADATSSVPSAYTAITPVTVLGRSLAAGSNTDVTVAGVGSVPSNATSVQLSVTALGGTATSSMYVYATGDTKPTSANVRWQTGEAVTIPVTVGVGMGGKIHLNTDTGTVTIKVAVVGYFSPATAPSGAGYATQATGPVAITALGGDMLDLSVPAGTYEVHAKLVATFPHQTGVDQVVCEIYDPASVEVDSSFEDVSGDVPSEVLSLVGLDTTSGGLFSIYCADGGSDSSAYRIDLVAVQLSSATGVVAGG